jgi:hypothetical protein
MNFLIIQFNRIRIDRIDRIDFIGYQIKKIETIADSASSISNNIINTVCLKYESLPIRRGFMPYYRILGTITRIICIVITKSCIL